MAITSQITGRPLFGQNPAGFTPLVPNNNEATEFIASKVMNLEFDYTDLTFVTDDIPATQANFLEMVQDYLDITYMPTVFTDATKSYVAEYVVTNVRLDFETTGTTSSRTIWVERLYKWFVQVTIKVNVD